MLSGKAAIANSNFIVCGLTGTEIDPTLYRTKGEQTNHYTTRWFIIRRIIAKHDITNAANDWSVYYIE